MSEQRPYVVLTNGAWHGAWCWSLVTPRLVGDGVNAVPIEIEGFGGLQGASPSARWARPPDIERFVTEPSPVGDVTLDSAVQRLLDELTRLAARTGGPLIVVAHSLGGVVVAEAAERAPHLFAALIFISAMTPVAGLPVSSYHQLPEMAESLLPANFVGDPAITGAFRCDFDSLKGRQTARRSFYHDVPDRLADSAVSLLSADAPAGVDGVVQATADGLGAIPKTWILCTEDRIVPAAVQHRLIRELDAISSSSAPTQVHLLASSHSPFLSQPDQLAALISAVASRTRSH